MLFWILYHTVCGNEALLLLYPRRKRGESSIRAFDKLLRTSIAGFYAAISCLVDPTEELRPILSNANIFGLDLYAAGIGERIESMVCQELAGPGAVRKTLKRYL